MPVRSFDAQGQVFLGPDRVLRGIFPGSGDQCRTVLEMLGANELARLGIVETRIAEGVELPGGPYELVLEHRRVPFVSYPHEWTASMLKDAARFHVDLFLALAPRGLTLKDLHPLNIVFDGTRPVFVDFTSIIPIEALQAQAYLSSASRPRRLLTGGWDRQAVLVNELYERMFVPYFLRPLLLMGEGRYEDARRRMLETTLNTSAEVIGLDELERTGRVAGLWQQLARDASLRSADPAKSHYFERLRTDIDRLDVAPPDSVYVNFYAAKGEEFDLRPNDAWSQRQRSIREILVRLTPRSVLDVAGNTGWFSRLAASLGANVVAFDIDEASADRLYHDATAEGARVLSLVMDLTRPTGEVAGLTYEAEPRRPFEDAPVLMPAAARLQSDLVLALAIAHHLALGQGMTLAAIADRLAGFARSALAVEFVDRRDRLIVDEPTFFPAMHGDPGSFDWYTLDGFETELRRHFATIERMPSHPESRTILLCSR